MVSLRKGHLKGRSPRRPFSAVGAGPERLCSGPVVRLAPCDMAARRDLWAVVVGHQQGWRGARTQFGRQTGCYQPGAAVGSAERDLLDVIAWLPDASFPNMIVRTRTCVALSLGLSQMLASAAI